VINLFGLALCFYINAASYIAAPGRSHQVNRRKGSD